MELAETEFLRSVCQDAPRMMWFLGAGASRSSGLPTATDLIWDLKRRLYCAEQNQEIQSHDLSNKAVQARIQNYLDSRGFPPLWDPSEYSFYFEEYFGQDYSAQQKYLRRALSTENVASTIGHRALAALLTAGLTRVVFTTNFDEVVESAYASMSGKGITPFHLEGAYAALEALNAEHFPLYVKLHGDFKYQSIKNLSADLVSNDAQLERAFIAAASRYGIVVGGYSGRDANVMAMFRQAIDQTNAFPHGIFWTVPNSKAAAPVVLDTIKYAQEKGINAGLVVTGTFDEMMSKIWRNIETKPSDLDVKVRTAIARPVSIALPGPGKRFPLLRTNALPIAQIPTSCGTVEYEGGLNAAELRAKFLEVKPECAVAYTDRLLFWGNKSEVKRLVDPARIRGFSQHDLQGPPNALSDSGILKSFVEEALIKGMVAGKPLHLARAQKTWFVSVRHGEEKQAIFASLRQALEKGKPSQPISGTLSKSTRWSEGVSLRLEERNGVLWLLLRPDIWIAPGTERHSATDFLRTHKLRRYNPQAFDLLSSWVGILLGHVGGAKVANVVSFAGCDFPATFEVVTRTSYSKRSAPHGR